MPAVNPGEAWMTDFGLAAKFRPALVQTSNPAADELDLVTLLPATTGELLRASPQGADN